MRALGALVFAILLGGCFGGCGPHDTLEWTDPTLYDALGLIDHGDVPAAAGVLDGARVGAPGGNVTRVQWRPASGDAHSREWDSVELADGMLTAQAGSDEKARALLTAFLANTSAADDPARRALVDAAIANKTKSLEQWDPDANAPVIVAWGYTASATGAWRLEALAEEVGAANTMIPAYAAPGTARHETGAYAFVVSYPVRSATLDGIPLTADLAGRVRAVPGERDGGNSTASVARVVAALGARSLPPPVSPTVATMVC